MAIESMGIAQRWKEQVGVPQPALIGLYNKAMGGTDLMNQNANLYRASVGSKRWWWAIFTWDIEVMINNAWLLYKEIMSHDEAHRDIYNK